MLTIVGGPMFSGKTTWLIEYTKSLQKESYRIFKPNIDTRYATHAIVTHNGQSLPAFSIDHLKPSFPPLSKKIKTILIDELNFFTFESIVVHIQKQLKLGRNVVGVGLFYDSYKQPFGATLGLSKIAHRTEELMSTCDNCGQKTARHSYRKIRTKKQISIGAGESYGPSCDNCWHILAASSSKHIP